jgi:RNA recognition motif-containing protein
LYVGNLNYKTRDNDLRDFFADKGDVVDAVVIMDKATNRSRGFGFVTMGSEADVNEALKLNDQELNGRKLRVNKAQQQEKSRPPRRRD